MSDQPPTSEQKDKLAVILLCGFSLLILGGISAGAISSRIPSDSQTLLGVIVGGLMLFSRECLQAIRAFWQDQRTGKLTDQIAASNPIAQPPPQDAIDGANQVADAAVDAAGRIDATNKDRPDAL